MNTLRPCLHCRRYRTPLRTPLLAQSFSSPRNTACSGPWLVTSLTHLRKSFHFLTLLLRYSVFYFSQNSNSCSLKYNSYQSVTPLQKCIIHKFVARGNFPKRTCLGNQHPDQGMERDQPPKTSPYTSPSHKSRVYT